MENLHGSSTVLKALCALMMMMMWREGIASSCDVDQLKAEVLTISQNDFKVTFKITNVGTKGVCMLKWNTMLDETFWPAATAVFLDGDLQEYSSPVIPLRQNIQDSDYAFINVGTAAAVTITRDLSEVFSFEDSRKYLLQIETRPQDCYTARRDTECLAKSIDSQSPLKYGSPEKATQDSEFIAQATKTASTQTFSEWLQINTPQQQNIDSTVVAFGTKKDVNSLFNELIIAHNDAHTYLELGSGYLKPYKESHLPMYEKWFGSYSKDSYNYVRDNMKESYKETNAPHVYNFLPSSMCKDSWIGFVDTVLLGKKQHVINLCSGFFLPTLKESGRALSLVREMIRDSTATQDKIIRGFDCYGAARCKELAKSKPNLVIEAAQSYALFSYDVYLSTRSSSTSQQSHPQQIVSTSPQSGGTSLLKALYQSFRRGWKEQSKG